MKKFIKITCLTFVILFGIIFYTGCSNKTLNVDFVRFNLGQRQNDYYIDFTLNFNNQTNNDIAINITDFYVKVNEEEFTSVALLYEYEEIFYASANVEKGKELNLRVRVVANLKEKNYNYLCIKYNNEKVIEDTIYIGSKEQKN